MDSRCCLVLVGHLRGLFGGSHLDHPDSVTPPAVQSRGASLEASSVSYRGQHVHIQTAVIVSATL